MRKAMKEGTTKKNGGRERGGKEGRKEGRKEGCKGSKGTRGRKQRKGREGEERKRKRKEEKKGYLPSVTCIQRYIQTTLEYTETMKGDEGRRVKERG